MNEVTSAVGQQVAANVSLLALELDRVDQANRRRTIKDDEG